MHRTHAAVVEDLRLILIIIVFIFFRQSVREISFQQIHQTRATQQKAFGETLTTGDEVVISELEHHSNFVPWQMLRDRHGITLNLHYPDDLVN